MFENHWSVISQKNCLLVRNPIQEMLAHLKTRYLEQNRNHDIMPYQKLLKELWALDSMYTNGMPTIPYHPIYGILYYTTIRIIFCSHFLPRSWLVTSFLSLAASRSCCCNSWRSWSIINDNLSGGQGLILGGIGEICLKHPGLRNHPFHPKLP